MQVTLDSDLVEILNTFNRPLPEVVKELIVLELYSQRQVSSGKAAELLGMGRIDFIRYSSELRIPFIDMTEEEWQAELETVRTALPCR
ncbi:MAG: UPF0175 family protein [Acidobacteria bacterium]|nr:UPF0175 family protein [Acidobacteriota bacterium]